MSTDQPHESDSTIESDVNESSIGSDVSESRIESDVSRSAIEESIAEAASAVGPIWPIHSFVTANPLQGFEDRPFHEAIEEARDLLGGDGYPDPATFRKAWEDGRIDPEILSRRLDEHGYDGDPEEFLERMKAAEGADGADPGDDGHNPADAATDEVDRILTKWLAAFLEEGRAKWSMPASEEGFWAAFRAVAPHDGDVPDGETVADLPEEPIDAIRHHLADSPVGEWTDVFESHLTALPGWVGLIEQRATGDGPWQSACPITLADYLAVRLTLADLLDAPLAPEEDPDATADTVGRDADSGAGRPLRAVWLSAWEETYREEVVEAISEASASRSPSTERPDAQLVFCIDTRSEVIRRHLETVGDYETHGYAGFFGVPMRYEKYDAEVAADACPPILDPEHRVAERPAGNATVRETHDRWRGVREAADDVLGAVTSNVATAFSFVESAGVGYGAALAARTLLPSRLADAIDALDPTPPTHEFCEPSIDYDPDAATDLREGLTLEEKVEYAATAFESMGWETFARLVVFTGHASQTTNNPFDSSLDCGACAGNPGGPNARVLAAICNDEAVRDALRERGIDVPGDTVFLAAEHDTTTDEVTLFDGHVPDSHREELDDLRGDLDTAGRRAAAERVGADDEERDGGADADAEAVREVERRAADWAETRPEWGLAGNAAFVIGPRDLTDDLDLDGRAFLHSYDWRTDSEGDALEAILAGPMVVTQWISAQYYFATVDSSVYGSGSKVTHNPVGNVGVYQGNGGDLATGLPVQSVKAAADEPYHQPLRLSTVIHAPVDRVTEVLAEHEDLVELLDNGWLSLSVVDPTRDHEAFHYESDLAWSTAIVRAEERPASIDARAVADD